MPTSSTRCFRTSMSPNPTATTRDCVPTELGGDVKLDMVQWALDRMQIEDSKGTSMGNGAATSSAASATSAVHMQDQRDRRYGEMLGASSPGSMYKLGFASSFSSGPISQLVNDAANTGSVERKRRADSFDEALDEFDAVVSSAFVKHSSTPDIDDAADLATKGLDHRYTGTACRMASQQMLFQTGNEIK